MCKDKCCGSCCKKLTVGDTAPTFTAEGYFKGDIRRYSLEDYKGKWVVLFFYPLDFTFVCPTELVEMSKEHKRFEEENIQVLGMSVDSVHSHQAWLKELGDFEYPLLSDITKRISKDYNVLLKEEGISLRGTFIIDPNGVVQCAMVNHLSVGRNVEEILRLIEAFKTGDLCPVGWKKGEDTLGKA